MDALNAVALFVQNNLMSSAAIVGVIVEFALRLTKSDKPLSIAHAVASGARKLGDILAGVANFLDKVLPQNLK